MIKRKREREEGISREIEKERSGRLQRDVPNTLNHNPCIYDGMLPTVLCCLYTYPKPVQTLWLFNLKRVVETKTFNLKTTCLPYKIELLVGCATCLFNFISHFQKGWSN